MQIKKDLKYAYGQLNLSEETRQYFNFAKTRTRYERIIQTWTKIPRFIRDPHNIPGENWPELKLSDKSIATWHDSSNNWTEKETPEKTVWASEKKSVTSV